MLEEPAGEVLHRVVVGRAAPRGRRSDRTPGAGGRRRRRGRRRPGGSGPPLLEEVLGGVRRRRGDQVDVAALDEPDHQGPSPALASDPARPSAIRHVPVDHALPGAKASPSRRPWNADARMRSRSRPPSRRRPSATSSAAPGSALTGRSRGCRRSRRRPEPSGSAVSSCGGPVIDHRSARAAARVAPATRLASDAFPRTRIGLLLVPAGPWLHSHRGNRSGIGLRRDGGILRRARALVRAPLRRPPRPRAPRSSDRRPGGRACGPWTPAAVPDSRRRSWRSSATTRLAWISRRGSCARRCRAAAEPGWRRPTSRRSRAATGRSTSWSRAGAPSRSSRGRAGRSPRSRGSSGPAAGPPLEVEHRWSLDLMWRLASSAVGDPLGYDVRRARGPALSPGRSPTASGWTTRAIRP